MKKILLTTILSWFFLIQLQAQVTFGIKAGAGLSILGYNSNNKYYEYDDKSKGVMFVPSIYGMVSIPVLKVFSIRSGIGFNQQGFSYTGSLSFYGGGSEEPYITYTDRVKARLNYIEVPLLIAYKLPFGQRKFDFFAGGSFGFNLGGRANIDRSVTPTYNPLYASQTSDHFTTDVHPGDVPIEYNSYNVIHYNNGIYSNPYNWSILVGANYQLNKRLLLGVEAKIGLSNVLPHDYRGGWVVTKQEDDRRSGVSKTQTYSFTVTYLLGQGEK